MNTPNSTSLALILTATLGASAVTQAGTNPFGFTEMRGGYMQLAAADVGATDGGTKKTTAEGKCGEGKCGGEKSAAEGKCGEGKCGGDKGATEGKCGEGKCGNSR